MHAGKTYGQLDFLVLGCLAQMQPEVDASRTQQSRVEGLDTDAANDHHHQSARREVVLSGQDSFE
jgi:hypothetical protein